MTKADAMVDHETSIGRPGANHDGFQSEGSPCSSVATAPSGLQVGSSFAVSHASTPISPLGSNRSLSIAAHADSSASVSDLSSPSSPTLFPGPLEREALKLLETFELPFRGNQQQACGLAESREVSDTAALEYLNIFELPIRDDQEHSCGPAGSYEARDTDDGEEDEAPTRHRHRVELPHRMKIPRTATYIDLTASDDDVAPENVIDLTGSRFGSSPVPPQEPQGSYLHRLPAELRNRVYRYVGLHGVRLELRNMKEPALAVAFPDLRDELHSFIFSANKLRIPIYSGFRTDSPPNASKKQPAKKDDLGDFNNSHVAPGMIGIAPDSWVMTIDPRFVTIKHICLRVLESHGSTSGHKHLCDYFVNVSYSKDGKLKVSGQTRMETTDILRRTINHMANLATARAKQCAQRDGFQGFTWEQVQHIVASFVSIADAKSRYTKKHGKVTLIEGMN